jgi:hypothetical protein
VWIVAPLLLGVPVPETTISKLFLTPRKSTRHIGESDHDDIVPPVIVMFAGVVIVATQCPRVAPAVLPENTVAAFIATGALALSPTVALPFPAHIPPPSRVAELFLISTPAFIVIRDSLLFPSVGLIWLL